MAQIPVGNFGRLVAQPGAAVNVPRMDVSSGIEAVANVGSAIQGEEQHHQLQELEQQNATKAALALATAQNALHDAHDEVTRGVVDGSIPLDDAQGEFKKRAGAVHDVQSEGLTQAHAEIMGVHLAGTEGELSRSLTGTVYKQRQSQTAATIDAFGEQVQREAVRQGPTWASEKYGAMLDFSGAAAGLTPEAIATKKQAFTERSTAAYYDGKANAMFAAGDLPGLASTLQEVTGPGGEPMDPVQRTRVAHQIIGFQDSLVARQDRLANAAQREMERREKVAEDTYTSMWTLVTTGKTLDDTAIRRLSGDTAGTGFQDAAAQLLANQSKVAGFATQSAPARAAVLERARAAGANPAVGTNPEREKVYGLLEKIDSAAQAAAKDNPWAAAQQYGVITNAPTMAAGGNGDTLALLDQRMQQIGAVENWVGRKVSPLQPAEAQQLSSALQSLQPAQAATMLSTIGQMVQDPERIAAIGKQLDDRGGVLGLAMAYAGDKTEDGKLVGELVLRGDQMTKNKTSQEDKTRAAGWRGQISTQLDGVFSDKQVEEKAIDAAVNIAVALDGDIDTAVKLATGGITTHGAAGAKIPLPSGMDAHAFETRLKQVTPEALAPQTPGGVVVSGRTQIPVADFVAQLPDATLVHAGQGMYVVKAGSSYVTNAAGQRIVLRVRP